MKIARILFVSLLSCLIVQSISAAAEPTTLPEAHVDHEGLKKLNWQLLIQPTALGDPTIFEAIDRLHAMVVHHIDLVEGQPISPDHLDAVLNADTTPELAAALLAKVKSDKMDFVTISVSDPMTNQAQCRKVLDLAKALKVKRIVCMPTADVLPILDKLTDEYRIGISIVNSAAGPYKDAASVLAALQGRSAKITACADLAEYHRAGIVPLDAVKALAGHLTDVRLTDVDNKGNIVPFDTGTVDMEPILAEIKKQSFKGATTLGAVSSPASAAPFIDSLNAFSDRVKTLAAEN